MRRVRFGFLLGLAALVAACDSGSQTPTTPTTPSVPVTDTFTGTINVNGAMTFTFAAAGVGSLAATLTSLTPDTTAQVGFLLGVWNGTNCQATLTNDASFQGTVILGQVNGTGALCARVYDVGKLTNSTAFEITVVHP
jgi:hypothetical protein